MRANNTEKSASGECTRVILQKLLGKLASGCYKNAMSVGAFVGGCLPGMPANVHTEVSRRT